MQNLYCNVNDLVNESDVEQKFLYKLLTNELPLGLGYSDSEINTKPCIKSYIINKGKQKTYIPDYLISVRGIPLIVVEAKNPNVVLNEAFAEAQLYAHQINNEFIHNVNPCNIVIVSNGLETWFGYIDSATPFVQLQNDDLFVGNVKFSEAIDKCCKKHLSNMADTIYKNFRANAIFRTPVSSLGGQRTINEEMISNDFGNALVSDYKNIFDPETENDRLNIVRNAYVHSVKREQHIEPIYKEIKKIKVPSLNDSTLLSTDNPKELITNVDKHITDKAKQCPLILIIGNRGSGKTTFIRYFKEKILDSSYQNISDKCEWCFLDMNYAPLDNNEIYEWVKENVIECIKESHAQIIDFDSKESLEKLYKKRIDSFKKGEGKYIEADTNLYNKELYNIIKDAKADKDLTLKGYVEYLNRYEDKTPIIVFDNCDKRNKDKQLLMFEVAQWIRKQFKCIVLLPMRDITYDMYKDQPPLDTFVRDLVFRIDPPDLLKVLISRLAYIERLNKNNIQTTHYTLENSIKVQIRPDELIDYYRQILRVIRNDDWARNIFYRSTNRDIRGAIQLFEDLCKSGHIKTSEILNMKLIGRDYHLPSYKIMNALLRKNRKYYNENNSNFINVFASDYKDDFPDPFIRLDILHWLTIKKDVLGPSLILGYHKINQLTKDLQLFGHKEDIIMRELNKLIQKGLICTENQNESIDNDDLIKISPSGSLHLKLMKNISYLAACSEAVLYKNTAIKDNISKRLAIPTYLNLQNQILNAEDMINYLIDYKQKYYLTPETFIDKDCLIKTFDLYEIQNLIHKMKEDISSYENCIGEIVECTVKFIDKQSLLVTFDYDKRGFLAVNDPIFKLPQNEYENLKLENKLICKIISYDYSHNSYKLEFCSTCPNQL